MSKVAKVTLYIKSEEENEDLIRSIGSRLRSNTIMKIEERYETWQEIKDLPN